MNIALFPSAFHPSLGGVEELTRQLALELQRQGHGVTVVTNRWPRDLPAREVLGGIEVLRLPMRFPGKDLKSKLTYVVSRGAVLRELVRLLRERRVDLIHVQCVSTQAHYALEAKKVLGVPLVATMQGELTMDAARMYQTSERARALLTRVVAEADAVTGCSRKTLDDVLEYTGTRPRGPAEVVFNGALVDDFRNAVPIKRDRPYVFALGRLVPQKGFDVLLESVSAALPPGWQLLLAGDGPEEGSLKAQVARLGLGEKVVFYGRADRKAVPGLMKGCEFVVVPSRADEGLPVVCAETMAAGKPIIGTTRGGIPEAVVDGETGLLVPPEDKAALTAAIKSLAGDAGLRARMSEAASARAALFEWPRVTGEYLRVYGLARPMEHRGA